jgi:hypothetical protein
MIGIRHRIASGDDDYLKHDAALVGSLTLRPVVAGLSVGERIRLSTYTVCEEGNPSRYFKNPLGGLRQYYIGTFDGLGLMKSVGLSVAYTEERGRPLAEALDASVNRKLFNEVIQSDEVTTERLDALADFCPCRLVDSVQEHEALIGLFFDTESEHGEEGRQRRRTLGILLDLARSLPRGGEAGQAVLDQHVFRGCVYSGVLPDGRAWELPPSADKVRSGWAVYQRNELLSVAVQCIFWVALQCLRDEKPALTTTADFTRWFAASRLVSESVAALGSQHFNAALEMLASDLPSLADWGFEKHEVAMAIRALEVYGQSTEREVRTDLLTLATRILLNLVARDDKVKPAYAPMGFPSEYLSLYPVNLSSLRALADNVWPGLARVTV